MADRYWVGDTDNDWNDDNNWASASGGAGGAGVPTASHDVYFDDQYTNANCTCDVAITCASLTVLSSYDGTLDFADSSFSHTINGNATFDGSGTVDCGNATITCSGNWDHNDQTTWTYATSTVVLNGTSKTVTGTNKHFYKLTIDGTITCTSLYSTTIENAFVINANKTFTMTPNRYCGLPLTVTINGTLNINGGYINFISAGATVTIGASGNITGTNMWPWLSITLLDNTAGGTYTATQIFRRSSKLSGGNYLNSNITLEASGNNYVATLGSAASQQLQFGNLTIDAASYNFTVNCNTFNPNLIVQNSLTFAQAGGTLTYNKGSGTITLSGTNNQTITTPAGWTQRLDDIVVNKSAGRVTLAGNVYTDTFTGTDGDFDLDGYTINTGGAAVDINGGSGLFRFWNGADDSMANGGGTHGKFDMRGGTGNLTLDGDAGAQLGIHDLDFDYDTPSTGTAMYCDVQDSLGPPGLAGSGAAIDATDASNTEVGGTNTGWNFGAVPTGRCLLVGADIGTL